MSATPLPALPVNPASTQPAPSSSRRSQHGDASFNSHLQSAQQRQQQAPQDPGQADAQNNDPGQGDGNAQHASAQASSASGDTAKPGADANDNQAGASNDPGPGIDLTGGVGTLVSTVLNLIDHAAGDTHAGSSGTPKQGGGNKQQAATPPPPVQAAAIVPVLLPAIALATPVAANTNAAQTGNALAGIGGGLANQPDLKADGSLSIADSSTAGSSAPADGGSAAQASSDGVQALAGSLAAGSHAALAAAMPFTADNSSQSTAGIAALGNLTATTPVIPSGTSAATHSLTTNAPVGSPGFAKELGQQITWLSGQDVKQAQIRLHPQDLGPLDVKVSVEHGRVDVSFVTQHPDATAAVQQSLGQLHQMLGGQGLSLGHATVGQQAQQQFAGQQNQQAQPGSGGDDIADTPMATAARIAIGLVDAFA